MDTYRPQKILLEKTVRHKPLAQRLLQAFSGVEVQEVEDLRFFKVPEAISGAKRVLRLAEHRGKALKPFPKVKHAFNLGDYVFNPISNCHLECRYCVLQSYLQNNPGLTVFANLEVFLEAISSKIQNSAEDFLRMGTGELSDSLALDSVTQLSGELVPFFARQNKAFLELKTKSNAIQNLLELDHRGQTVVSFSLSPSEIAQAEELKCASVSQRLRAAAALQAKGYPIGLHLDPMIYFESWEKAYETLISQISQYLDPKRLAWVSLGTLRFDRDLKKVAQARFSKTKIFSGDFLLGQDGKFRYFKKIRQRLYRQVLQYLADYSNDFPRYLCMEPPWLWESVLGGCPDLASFEASLGGRLKKLARECV